MKSLSYQTKVLLIELGKQLPFVVCGIVLISYVENFYALYCQDYLVYDGYYILNKPISWAIGRVFEYNFVSLVILSVISFAINTCVWNKLATSYLFFQLYIKDYFSNHIYDSEIYYLVTIANIVFSLFFVWKGINILTKTKRK